MTVQKIADVIAAEVAAAERASDDVDAPLPDRVRVTRGHDRSRVLQVRLSESEYQVLAAHASTEHVPASTYARAILLRGLAS